MKLKLGPFDDYLITTSLSLLNFGKNCERCDPLCFYKLN